MRALSSSRPPLPLWKRFAAWLSFLAVLSALGAPVSLLAEEVQSGKLGGLCMASSGTNLGALDSGAGEAAHSGTHCEWCGSAGLVLPPWPALALPSCPGFGVQTPEFPADLATVTLGLPYSRGPPLL